MPTLRPCLCALRLLALVLSVIVAMATVAAAQPRPATEASQDWKRAFSAIESALRAQTTTPSALETHARTLREIADEAGRLRAVAEQEIATRQRLLDALGPPPQEGEPAEVPEVAAQRRQLNEAITALRAEIALTDFAITRSAELREALSKAYRADFTTRMLERRPVPLSPGFYLQGLSDIAGLFEKIIEAPIAAYRVLPPERQESLWLSWQTLAIAIAVLVAWPIRRVLLRRFGPDPSTATPTYARRLVAAVAVALAYGLIPAVLLMAIYVRISAELELDTGLAADVVRNVAFALLFVIVVAALARAALAPDNPAWRLTRLTARSARRLNRMIVVIAAVYIFDQALTRIGFSLDPSEEAAVTWVRGIGLIEAACLVLLARRSLWKIERAPPPSEETGPAAVEAAPPPAESRWIRVARYAVALAAVASVIAKGLGYVALGHHILQGLLHSSVVVAALYLVNRLAEDAIAVLATARLEDGRLRFTGEPRPNLRFWLEAVVHGIIYAAAIYALLIIWGVPHEDLRDWVTGVLGGFRVGGVMISPTDLGAGLAVLIAGVFLAGRLRRVLEQRILPRTNLDVGVRNSLATGASYVGFVLAAVIAVAVAGFDVSNLAIVAGALSVGIGFGLQNIVNNFVSGLILLAERPIKVGDLVIVGDKQGYVQRISVRATEILTFDRSSVILPNSTLLSQAVVNLTHQDKSGRVEIRVGVAYGTDPEKVRQVLLDCANRHPAVVSWPKAVVAFADFGASSLDFILYAYLSDVEKRLSVASDLRFAIDKAFRENGIEIPFAQNDVHLRDIDKLVEAIRGQPSAAGSASPPSAPAFPAEPPAPAPPAPPPPIPPQAGTVVPQAAPSPPAVSEPPSPARPRRPAIDSI